MTTAPSLHPLTTSYPEQMATSHACWEVVWKVAAVAVLVAFSALAVVGLVFSSIYAPIYLPIISILAMQLAPFAYKGYEILQAHSLAYGAMATRASLIGKQLELLPTTSEEIRNRLQALGLNPQIDDCTVLRSTLARHNYFEDEAEKSRLKLEEKRDQVATESKEERPKMALIFQAQREILQLKEEIALDRFRTAVLRGVLANPTDLRDPDMFECPFSWDQRLLYKYFNEEEDNYDMLIRRPNPSNEKMPYILRIRDIERMTIPEITAFIFAEPQPESESA